jgi:hypothetical protein
MKAPAQAGASFFLVDGAFAFFKGLVLAREKPRAARLTREIAAIRSETASGQFVLASAAYVEGASPYYRFATAGHSLNRERHRVGSLKRWCLCEACRGVTAALILRFAGAITVCAGQRLKGILDRLSEFHTLGSLHRTRRFLLRDGCDDERQF